MIHHVSWGRDGYSLPMVCTIGTYVVGSALFLVFWGGRRGAKGAQGNGAMDSGPQVAAK
jgi:hypothetical protein